MLPQFAESRKYFKQRFDHGFQRLFINRFINTDVAKLVIIAVAHHTNVNPILETFNP